MRGTEESYTVGKKQKRNSPKSACKMRSMVMALRVSLMSFAPKLTGYEYRETSSISHPMWLQRTTSINETQQLYDDSGLIGLSAPGSH